MFNVWIESIIPTIGPEVLKYGECNGEGLNPELESQKSKFSDWGTLKCLLSVLGLKLRLTFSNNHTKKLNYPSISLKV